VLKAFRLGVIVNFSTVEVYPRILRMKSLRRTVQLGSNLARKEIVGAPPCNFPLLFSKSKPPQLFTVPTRSQTGYTYKGSSSYYGSTVIDEKTVDLYTKCEKSYEEWKYVEKLMPHVYVPDAPTDPNQEFPSGWHPPRVTRENCHLPYFISRTKNHMVPVYLVVPGEFRGEVRRTQIKFVEGNLWVLEKEIAAFLQAKYPKKVIGTWVNESWRQVFVRGEYVNDVREWVLDRGF